MSISTTSGRVRRQTSIAWWPSWTHRDHVVPERLELALEPGGHRPLIVGDQDPVRSIHADVLLEQRPARTDRALCGRSAVETAGAQPAVRRRVARPGSERPRADVVLTTRRLPCTIRSDEFLRPYCRPICSDCHRNNRTPREVRCRGAARDRPSWASTSWPWATSGRARAGPSPRPTWSPSPASRATSTRSTSTTRRPAGARSAGRSRTACSASRSPRAWPATPRASTPWRSSRSSNGSSSTRSPSATPIRVVTRVAALEPRSRGRRGVVTWHRQLLNQDGQGRPGRHDADPRPRPAPRRRRRDRRRGR